MKPSTTYTYSRHALWGVLLLALPLVLQQFGNGWVRIADMALLYVMLALGLNIVVGYAGLLDLGFVAFFAVGAYMFGLLASPHLIDNFPAMAAMFPNGIHTPWWAVIPLGAGLAGLFGILLGAPTLKLRGDYLAIVTLGFGVIGWVDDYRKVVHKNPKGMASREKFFWQTLIGLFAAIPAVVAYNRYSHDVDRLAIRFETFIEEFSNILNRQAR